jgi:hypothetical protein
MILNRYAADFGQTLVDLEVSAVKRQASKADWGGVVDQLHGRHFREQQFHAWQ